MPSQNPMLIKRVINEPAKLSPGHPARSSPIWVPWRTEWELQVQELHYGNAAVQPGLNELL